MIKPVSDRIERIFSHSAALQQSGRLRNTVYCIKSRVYILNQDSTTVIKFPLRVSERVFTTPVSFDASDYDSSVFGVKDGKVCFVRREGDYIREKCCKPCKLSPIKISKLFKQRSDECIKRNKVLLNDSFVNCLQKDLGHIEFSGCNGALVVRQRDIYTGSLISITKRANKSLGVINQETLKNFGPIGIRTNDFLALFTFVSSVFFYFAGKHIVWFESNDRKMPFVGMISHCKYDELGRS